MATLSTPTQRVQRPCSSSKSKISENSQLTSSNYAFCNDLITFYKLHIAITIWRESSYRLDTTDGAKALRESGSKIDRDSWQNCHQNVRKEKSQKIQDKGANNIKTIKAVSI